MTIPNVTPDFLTVILTTLLTLAADYFPKFAAWFDDLDVADKRRFMVAGAVVISGSLFAIQCFGIVDGSFVCTPTGVVNFIYTTLLSFAIAQGVHAGTKPTPEFKAKVLKIA